MHEFADAEEVFAGLVTGIKNKKINYKTSLDEMVLKISKDNLAYVDNRRDAKKKHRFDFWAGTGKLFKDQSEFTGYLRQRGIAEKIMYSKSEAFPDFIYKARKTGNDLTCGSLLELKDSKGGSIASFNSTLPTKFKNLVEIDIINGNDIVSRITSIKDEKLALNGEYRSFQRRNLYLIRTYKDNKEKVKISIIDGSFFETLPKEHLIYQMFLNILRNHIKSKKDIKISGEALLEIEKTLSCITDQTIIAASQNIEKASIRPRLRIMAEVHSEGNPHSSHYPEITGRSLNLIIQSTEHDEKIKREIAKKKFPG
ncbi:MAG: hypothetical protein CVT47_01150 [Thermoplasmata archaeon HGW-Thermoplasmata-2]|nr:MAG: hypothetical protein CVT47_01150 [Thermoplasmata archaeon HGW-Thermoplasmata-2]